MTGTPTPGEVLGDRYQLERGVWTSSLGPVWRARDPVLDRPVFVQLLSPTLQADADARRAFAKTAARIAQVQHQNLARIYDIGTDPGFVVFEYAAGGRLSDRLERGPLRVPDAAKTALSIARALETLHAADASHGSLAPTSVLLDAEGRPLVLAIGAAQTTAPVASVDAADEQPEGYQAPGPSTPEGADAYALAALTMHMMTGKPPGKIAARRLTLPGGLSNLLQRALDADPSKRPPLERFISNLAPFVRMEEPKARRPRTIAAEFSWLTPAIIILVVAVLAITIGVSLVQTLSDGEPEATPTPSPSTPSAQPITIVEATDFDPHGSDGEEQPERVRFAFDGDPETEWRTLNYASPTFDKPGVGLLFDLGTPTPIGSVEIISDLSGWEAELRVSNTDGTDEDDFEELMTFTGEFTTALTMPDGTATRFVLLWLTRAVEHGQPDAKYPHRVEINEVTFFSP